MGRHWGDHGLAPLLEVGSTSDTSKENILFSDIILMELHKYP